MKIAFENHNFRDTSLARIAVCNGIIDEYLPNDLRLTLRQLYYQLVSRNIIPNREQTYKALGNLIKNGRLAGMIDWEAIEDRGRRPIVPAEFDDLADLVDSAIRSYRLPRWKGQRHYIELWTEKDALANVLTPLASEYHATMMVNRGYSSLSAMFDAAQRRFLDHGDCDILAVVYLGDHDPSGEDMLRDIRDRLNLLSWGLDVRIQKVAITWDQVQQYAPPPNPTKKTDSRTKAYVAKYGPECWEVDALPPRVLYDLTREAIEGHVDMTLMDAIKAKENADKARLRDFVKGLDL